MKKSIVALAIGLCLLLPQFADGQQLNDQRFHELKALFEDETEKPWRSIDWNVSLLGAQNIAAESGKPIFIWAMDGHPLGCT